MNTDVEFTVIDHTFVTANVATLVDPDGFFGVLVTVARIHTNWARQDGCFLNALR